MTCVSLETPKLLIVATNDLKVYKPVENNFSFLHLLLQKDIYYLTLYGNHLCISFFI